MDNNTNCLVAQIAELNIKEINRLIENLILHFKNLLSDQIISETNYYEHIDKFKKYSNELLSLKKNLNILILERDNNLTETKYELLELKAKITNLRIEIVKIILEHGYNSIIDMFEYILSYEQYSDYKDEIIKKLNFVENYFIVTKLKKTGTTSLKQVNFKLKSVSLNKKPNNSDGENNFINLIYEVNKGVIEMEIDDTIYTINGYFKEDSINQIYKDTIFEGKYRKLLSQCLNSKDKSIINIPQYKTFVKEYLTQLSIKDFILKDINEIYMDILENYSVFNKISKSSIIDLIGKFMEDDIYTKRNTIILLLISDSDYDEYDYDDEIFDQEIYQIKASRNFQDIPEKYSTDSEDNLKKSEQDKSDKSDKTDKTDKLDKKTIQNKINNVPIKMNKTTATRYAISSIMKNFDTNVEKSFTSLMNNSKKLLNANVIVDFIRQNSMKPDEYKNFINSIHQSLRRRIFAHTEKNDTKSKLKEELTYEMKLELLNLNEKTKQKVEEKIKELRTSKENAKAETFIEGFFKIPFNTYIKEDVFVSCENLNEQIKNQITRINKFIIDDENLIKNSDTIEKIQLKTKYYSNIQEIKSIANTLVELKQQLVLTKTNYLTKVDGILEKAIYGHKDSKREIKRVIAQWMNGGEMGGTILGFHGPPGVGKTVFAQKGIGKCLFDSEGKTRPFCIFQLGGASDGAVLEGHNYTYVGAKWGRLVEMLMDSKCMNPIIYFDELDKISNTDKGREIVDILIHLTDKSQNKHIFDRYFSGVELDFSKCLIIFSYNDISKVDRILRDRITEIKINPLKKQEKVVITQNYTLKEISESLNTICEIPDNLVEYIIETYTLEPGVRKLNEKLYEIFRELNLRNLENPDDTIELTKELIDEILTRHYKIRHYQIHTKPEIGLVNGLYASTVGLGGITLIQVIKSITSSNSLPLELTGQQGDVMKESMSCAKTLALRLLSEEQRTSLTNQLKESPFGLHIHCPDTSTPKDGPSAGITITTGIYSLLTNRPIRNDIAMTGEVDLLGNVKAIGGLDAKINGAIKAGVKKVLFPKENEQDYNKILESKCLDGEIECVMVEKIEEVIEHAIL